MNFFKKLFGLTDNKNNETLNYKEEIIEEPISEEPKEEMIEEPISEEPKEEMIEELILEEKENSNKIENITDNTLSLNDYQKEAVINEDDACIVSANVGSGKTTVLISKVLYLSQKYDIKDLIILTFFLSLSLRGAYLDLYIISLANTMNCSLIISAASLGVFPDALIARSSLLIT